MQAFPAPLTHSWCLAERLHLRLKSDSVRELGVRAGGGVSLKAGGGRAELHWWGTGTKMCKGARRKVLQRFTSFAFHAVQRSHSFRWHFKFCERNSITGLWKRKVKSINTAFETEKILLSVFSQSYLSWQDGPHLPTQANTSNRHFD